MLLLAAMWLPLAPLLLAQSGSGAGLLACCRRGAKHECGMMKSAAHASDAPIWQAPLEKCPCCPRALAAAGHADTMTPSLRVVSIESSASHPAGVAQTDCKRRIARDRSRQKRGPPTALPG